MKKALILFFAGLLSWNVIYAAAPDVAGIVSVGRSADAPSGQLRTGFVADGRGHIIARINVPEKPLFVRTADGASYMAHTVLYDGISGLSLLQVADGAANLKPYTLARDPAELQRKVYAIEAGDSLEQSRVIGGTLARLQEPESDARPGYYLHNALTGETGMGGPLLNNCGELIGVVVPKPGFLARVLGGKSNTATAYALPIEWVISRFGTQGLHPVRAAEACLSEADQTAALAQAAAAAQAEAEEKERQRAAAQAEAEEKERQRAAAQAEIEEKERAAAAAAEQAETAQAELDAVKTRLEESQGASEEERRRLEAEIETRRQTLEEARIREAAARDEHETLLRAAQEREKQYFIWGASGAVLLLTLLLLVLILKRRAVARERREKIAASSEAEQARASLAAHEEDEARIRRAPTVFLEGKDDTGQSAALRIPGASIAAGNGVVVGRNPADSDFVINHPEVSRRQFRLFIDGDLLMLEDLGSTNGTRVDGKKLAAGQQNVLADKSRVELGDLKLSARLERDN